VKAYVRTEVWLDVSVISSLPAGTRSPSRPDSCFPWKKLRYPFYRILDRPQSRSRCWGFKKKLLSVPYGTRICLWYSPTPPSTVKVKQSHYRPWGFQEVEAPRFQENRHLKVVSLSTLCTGRLYPQEIFLVLIYVGGWVEPRAIVRPEGLYQWKIPMTPSGIGPTTFRLVAQCPTHQHCTRWNIRHETVV
jgi:hypothetical protein